MVAATTISKQNDATEGLLLELAASFRRPRFGAESSSQKWAHQGPKYFLYSRSGQTLAVFVLFHDPGVAQTQDAAKAVLRLGQGQNAPRHVGVFPSGFQTPQVVVARAEGVWEVGRIVISKLGTRAMTDRVHRHPLELFHQEKKNPDLFLFL